MEELTEEDRQVLGPYIKALSQQQHKTQKQLAQETGIARGTVSKLWRGLMKGSKHYESVCQNLGIGLDQALEKAYEHQHIVRSVPTVSVVEEVTSPSERRTRSGVFGDHAITIAVAAEKGGVGKTTTAVSLASVWAERGHAVLLVDLDTQGNASSYVGFGKTGGEQLLRCLTKPEGGGPLETLEPEVTEFGFDLVAGGRRLAAASSKLSEHAIGHLVLKRLLDPLRELYDFILLDTPPALGAITVGGLVASDQVLIPAQTEAFAYDGVLAVLSTVEEVQMLKPSLRVLGTVPTLHRSTQNNDQVILHDLMETPGTRVFSTTIDRRVELGESTLLSTPITVHAPESSSARAYRSLADECERRLQS